VEEVIHAVSPDTVVDSARATLTKGRQPKTSRARLTLATTLVLVLVLLILGLTLRNRLTLTKFKSRRSIAVLGFKNLTGRADAAWLSTAFAEMLTTELAAGEKLRTVPGEDVARMSVELALPDSSSFGSDTLARIRNYIGADIIVYGS